MTPTQAGALSPSVNRYNVTYLVSSGGYVCGLQYCQLMQVLRRFLLNTVRQLDIAAGFRACVNDIMLGILRLSWFHIWSIEGGDSSPVKADQ